MYVIVYLRRGGDGRPKVAGYGATSDNPTLLETHGGGRGEPDNYDVRAVLRVKPGGLLSVSRSAAERALTAAGY